MRKIHLFSTLVALSLATSSLLAKPAAADANGKLPGGFTINADCDMVYFSQGNLQYIGSEVTPYWKFADEQYEYFGETTGQNSTAANVDRDLFGWATSGNSASGTCYEPWQCSTSSDYGNTSKSDGTNPGSGVNWDASKADWGQNMPGTWRTLKSTEWDFMINQRNNYANLRTYATVHDVQGLILLPDGWTVAASEVASLPMSMSNKTVTDGDWTILEKEGAVFLPAAGYRYWTFVSDAGTCGYYWSSTASTTGAYNLNFRFGNVDPRSSNLRYLGVSVRLVQDIPAAEAEALRPKASVATPPTAVTNLVYNGYSKDLVNDAYGATGGTVKYKLSTSDSWSTTRPSATNAGEYIVQWFVEASGCIFSSDIQEIHVTIARGTASAPNPMPTIEAASLTYNSTPLNLVTVSGSLQSGYTTVYSTDGVNWSTTIPQGTNPGNYTVYYKFYKGANEEYIPSPNTIDVTIAKADLSVDLPASTSSIPYDGTEKTLVEIDPVTNATIYYKLGDGDWTTTPPTGTDAGDYSVQYKIVPNDAVNYNTIGPNTVTVTILDYPTVYDNADPTTKLTELLNTPSDLKVKRTIYADDEYNTICLPFALDESALAASPLAGFNRLKTFKGAQVTGTAPDFYIDIFVEDATTIEAGVPYLITYPSAHADIVNPVFTGITVSTTEPGNVEADGVTFQGMFAQVHIDPYDAGHTQDYLFVGANSQLYWPLSTQTSSDIKMRGFRAYFIIDRNSISPALAPKGTRARIMDAPKTTTAIDNPSAKFGGSEKIIENGILYIIRNGVHYNAQGQIVK